MDTNSKFVEKLNHMDKNENIDKIEDIEDIESMDKIENMDKMNQIGHNTYTIGHYWLIDDKNWTKKNFWSTV